MSLKTEVVRSVNVAIPRADMNTLAPTTVTVNALTCRAGPCSHHPRSLVNTELGANMRSAQKTFAHILLAVLTISQADADERYFTYSYDAGVLPQGQLEFEQWVTPEFGRKGGDFARWNFREELEYGLTDNLQTALYLNFRSTRTTGFEGEEDSSETEFKGISSEWIYQLSNPNLQPVGLALYGEYTTDGIDHELEGKVIVSKNIDNWVFASNAIYEAEWEKEDGESEEEAVLEFTAGASYKVTPQWSVGVEARNKRAFPDGLDLNGEEYSIWSVGPNLHYGAPSWWATLTVLPQVYGNGDGASGNIQAVHEERAEARLLVGVLF